MRKGNISIFVPHIGCPHKCSFCNQNIITGQQKAPTPQDVKDVVDGALALNLDGYVYEIAFFGGSFTAIDKDYMISLLEAAYPYVKNGDVMGIRISTRPDCIDKDILAILKKYGVTSIELGAQSMNKTVLQKNMRGHTVEDIKKSAALIKKKGFELGLQMMTGLYGSNDALDMYTANEIIKLQPDTVRIYPTVVLENTYLAKLYEEGKYKVNGVEESVKICAKIVPLFKENGIRIIRLGLHSSEVLKSEMLAGGFHDCLGELVTSRIMLNEILEQPKGKYLIFINHKSMSKILGNRKMNLAVLKEQGYYVEIYVDDTIVPDNLRIEPYSEKRAKELRVIAEKNNTGVIIPGELNDDKEKRKREARRIIALEENKSRKNKGAVGKKAVNKPNNNSKGKKNGFKNT